MEIPAGVKKVSNNGWTFEVKEVTGLFKQGHDWTEEWEAGEREAEEGIQAGRVTHFDNPEDAVRHLRNL